MTKRQLDPRWSALLQEEGSSSILSPKSFNALNVDETRITLASYRQNNAMAVSYKSALDWVIISVNILGISEKMQPGVFAVKNWSENTKAAEEALASGLFEDTGITIPAGYCNAPVWKIKGAK